MEWEFLITYLIIPGIKISVVVLILSGAIAYLTLLERKLIAHIQVRLGPMRVGWHGLLQPIADGIKFVAKEDIIPSRSDALIFTLGPIISLIPAFLVFAVVPFGPPDMLEGPLTMILGWILEPEAVQRVVQNSIASGGFITDLNIGILFILSVSSVGILGIILGGWASNSKYPLLGALRSSAQMVSYEVALGFSIIGVLLVARSLSLVEIVEQQQADGIWYFALHLVFCPSACRRSALLYLRPGRDEPPAFRSSRRVACRRSALLYLRAGRDEPPAFRSSRGRNRTGRGISHRVQRISILALFSGRVT